MTNKPLKISALSEFMAKLHTIVAGETLEHNLIKAARKEAEFFDRIDENDKRERVKHVLDKLKKRKTEKRYDQEKERFLAEIAFMKRAVRQRKNGEPAGYTFSNECLNWSLNQDNLAIFCFYASGWICKSEENFKAFVEEFTDWHDHESAAIEANKRGGGQASALAPTQSTKPAEKAIEPAPEPVAEVVVTQEQDLTNNEIDAQIEKLNELKQRNNKLNEKVADYDFK